MTDPADFLSRWSQRKRAAAKGELDRKADPDEPSKPADGGTPGSVTSEEDKGTVGEVSAETAHEPRAFDPSQLPSIETITAETDIRAFLAPGVPSALRQAALRRMWSADPAIRDFIEIAENQWDFNAGKVPGFDSSAPIGAVKRMVADIFGDKHETDSAAEAQSEGDQAAEPAEVLPVRPDAAADGEAPEAEDRAAKSAAPVAMQHGSEGAKQPLAVSRHEVAVPKSLSNDEERDTPVNPRRRSHGGAMPK